MVNPFYRACYWKSKTWCLKDKKFKKCIKDFMNRYSSEIENNEQFSTLNEKELNLLLKKSDDLEESIEEELDSDSEEKLIGAERPESTPMIFPVPENLKPKSALYGASQLHFLRYPFHFR